jgi:hypothetical protein
VPEIDTDVPVKFAVAVVEACYRTGAEVYWLDNQVPDMDTRKKAKLPALPTDDR